MQELSLLDYDMLHFKPSSLAIAALTVAQVILVCSTQDMFFRRDEHKPSIYGDASLNGKRESMDEFLQGGLARRAFVY